MRGGFCCGRRGLGHYPRDGLLSLFCGPGYVGHQLLKPSLNFSEISLRSSAPPTSTNTHLRSGRFAAAAKDKAV